MANVRPPTTRVRVADANGYMTSEFLNILFDLIDRAGGVGDVTLLQSLVTGTSTDNAVTRFSGTGGDQLQSSQVTIDDSGNVDVPAGATVDGRDVSVDGSKLDGIEAGATADQAASEVTNDSSVTGTSVADALDNLDATTGSWTPVLEGSSTTGTNSYTTQTATYERIGDIVLIHFDIELDGTAGALDSAGNLSISGLPFAQRATFSSSGSVGTYSGLNLMSGRQPYFEIEPSASAITILKPDNASSLNLTDSDGSDSMRLRASMVYRA